MIQDQVCYDSHATYKDLQRCSGVGGTKLDEPIKRHAKWDADACPWREVSPGVEVYPVLASDLDPAFKKDPSTKHFVAGYALRFKLLVVTIPKLGKARATLREKTTIPSKLFQSPAIAAGYAAVKNAKASEKKRAHDAILEESIVDPMLGRPGDRAAAEAAYVRGRITGDMREYERARAKLPRQPEPQL